VRNRIENCHLAREEVDFSRVPKSQLQACYLWEYSREFVKDGNKLPVELLDIISAKRGFEKYPFQSLSNKEQEKVFKKHRKIQIDEGSLKNTYFLRALAASILLEEVLKKKKSQFRMIRKYLKQLGVLRLFKAGFKVETAMEFTFGLQQDDEDWLSRSKYRQYQREARRMLETWPSCVIPPPSYPD